MWIYSQASGVLARDGEKVCTGYAGGNIPPNFDPKAKNNPEREKEHNFGPLPCGDYKIGPAEDNPVLGRMAMALTPDPANVMYGRSGFFIHGDSLIHPGEASEGCIVMPFAVRWTIAASTDRDLQVTP